jgi:hypothetical protein
VVFDGKELSLADFDNTGKETKTLVMKNCNTGDWAALMVKVESLKTLLSLSIENCPVGDNCLSSVEAHARYNYHSDANSVSEPSSLVLLSKMTSLKQFDLSNNPINRRLK